MPIYVLHLRLVGAGDNGCSDSALAQLRYKFKRTLHRHIWHILLVIIKFLRYLLLVFFPAREILPIYLEQGLPLYRRAQVLDSEVLLSHPVPKDGI